MYKIDENSLNQKSLYRVNRYSGSRFASPEKTDRKSVV